MRPLVSILLTAFIIFNVSCKKDNASSKRACWQLIDFSGNYLNQVCDKTEAELIACVGDSSCGNYAGLPRPLTNCFYFKKGGDEFCWLINGTSFIKNKTEAEAQLLARCFWNNGTLQNMGCNDCKLWFNREKRTYKPTSSVSFSVISNRYYCTDTLATLYSGREIIRKDDADSLIVIQFSDDGVNW